MRRNNCMAEWTRTMPFWQRGVGLQGAMANTHPTKTQRKSCWLKPKRNAPNCPLLHNRTDDMKIIHVEQWNHNKNEIWNYTVFLDGWSKNTPSEKYYKKSVSFRKRYYWQRKQIKIGPHLSNRTSQSCNQNLNLIKSDVCNSRAAFSNFSAICRKIFGVIVFLALCIWNWPQDIEDCQ